MNTTQSNLSNPLLSVNYRFDFGALKPEHIEPAIDQLIARAKEDLARVANLKGERTFENTMIAFDRAGDEFTYAVSIINLIENVATTPLFREKYNAVQARISEFSSSIYVDPAVWNAIKAFRDSSAGKSLQGSRKRYLDRVVTAFVRNGADLPQAQKERVIALNSRLTEITNRYRQNVLDSTNAFEWVAKDESQLAGLPISAKEMAKDAAKQKGIEGYRFTLQMPSYAAIVTYHENPAIRELFYRAHSVRASSGEQDNSALVVEILKLRRERAQLFGEKDFSDFVTKDRMAGSGARAEEFETRIESKVRPGFERDIEQLQKFRNELEGPNSPALQPWDLFYYGEKLQKKSCNLDPEAFRPYFQFEKVLEGIFSLANKLFGITISKEQGISVWDPSVRVFAVHDEKGKRLGHFFADYFPRESKRGGAWMDSIVVGIQNFAGREEHIGFMGGNFSPPTADRPALLTHEEVLTLFHEAGHLFHGMLGKVELTGQSMNAVPWDFIELPSQLMENWAWEKDILDTFATHYQTGEKIPVEMFEALKKARNFQNGIFYMRQIGLGIVDLSLHRTYDLAKHGEVVAFSRELYSKFSFKLTNDHAMVNSFTHLFDSPVAYASGYYSYLWAEVLEADAFTRFKNEGLTNPKVGRAYRTAILERGDAEDPMQMFKDFLGREPDENAMLRRAELL